MEDQLDSSRLQRGLIHASLVDSVLVTSLLRLVVPPSKHFLDRAFASLPALPSVMKRVGHGRRRTAADRWEKMVLKVLFLWLRIRVRQPGPIHELVAIQNILDAETSDDEDLLDDELD